MVTWLEDFLSSKSFIQINKTNFQPTIQGKLFQGKGASPALKANFGEWVSRLESSRSSIKTGNSQRGGPCPNLRKGRCPKGNKQQTLKNSFISCQNYYSQILGLKKWFCAILCKTDHCAAPHEFFIWKVSFCRSLFLTHTFAAQILYSRYCSLCKYFSCSLRTNLKITSLHKFDFLTGPVISSLLSHKGKQTCFSQERV